MTGKTCILVVDDDDDVRSTVAEVLEDVGYDADTASNGCEALARLEGDRLRPALILLDMMMPVMDGAAFLKEVQKRPSLAGIPIVLFSAYGNPKEVAAELGATDYLRKPVRLEELVGMVARSLRDAPG